MQADAVKAQDIAAAKVFMSGVTLEGMEAKGIYTVRHYGPREEVRAEYIALRDKAFAIEADAKRYGSRTFKRKDLRSKANALRRKMREMEEQKSPDDTFKNIVTTVGKNDMLDKYLAGSSYTAVPRMLLKGTGTAVIGDTQASHAGWLEQGLANAPAYTGNRPSPSFSAASGGAKSTSAAVTFAITSSGTVFGAAINMNGSATKDDTTGILFSAGDFSGGSKAVTNGDTLSVTYSMTLT
jgi:hypothetical protein